MKKTLYGIIALLTMTAAARAEGDGDRPSAPEVMMWGRITMGKIVSSAVETGKYDIGFKGEWLENVEGGVKLIRRISPRLSGRLNIGIVINTSTVNPPGLTFEYSTKKIGAALLDAALHYTLGDLFYTDDVFETEFGYFPFKYNPQSTSLGEYLFRSGTYPGYLVSGFEHSIDRPKLGGIHLAYTVPAFGTLRQDFLLTTELDVFPYHDINLTYIATHSLGPVFTLGAGVELARLIAVDPRKTTLGLDTTYTNKAYYETKIGYIDTVNKDTILYTFKGTKLMGRATLDLKELVGLPAGLLGNEELKLYGEAALLGVKNYLGWYNKIEERIPVMLGFSLPTFRILDVLSIEVERYASPYWNSQEYIWKGDSPIPYIGSGNYPHYDRDWNDSLAKTDDDFKWSIYASKKIGKLLRISAQAASDHTPKNWYTPWPAPQSAKYTDMVPMTKDWYFMMRVSFYF